MIDTTNTCNIICIDGFREVITNFSNDVKGKVDVVVTIGNTVNENIENCIMTGKKV